MCFALIDAPLNWAIERRSITKASTTFSPSDLDWANRSARWRFAKTPPLSRSSIRTQPLSIVDSQTS